MSSDEQTDTLVKYIYHCSSPSRWKLWWMPSGAQAMAEWGGTQENRTDPPACGGNEAAAKNGPHPGNLGFSDTGEDEDGGGGIEDCLSPWQKVISLSSHLAAIFLLQSLFPARIEENIWLFLDSLSMIYFCNLFLHRSVNCLASFLAVYYHFFSALPPPPVIILRQLLDICISLASAEQYASKINFSAGCLALLSSRLHFLRGFFQLKNS
jgi:hypothetical protein